MAHIVDFLTPPYFHAQDHDQDGHESSLSTSSDIENKIPNRPITGSVPTKGRTVLAPLNPQYRSPLSSACSSQLDNADTCASIRPIVALTESPKWQQQANVLYRERDAHGIDSTLESKRSLLPISKWPSSIVSTRLEDDDSSKDNTSLITSTEHTPPRAHWFHRFNIFQKFRRAKDDELSKPKRGEEVSVEAASCYNEFKTTDIDQLLKTLEYRIHRTQTPQWGYLDEDYDIPLFAPLHELNDEQIAKLKQDLYSFSELDSSSSDQDLSALLSRYNVKIANVQDLDEDDYDYNDNDEDYGVGDHESKVQEVRAINHSTGEVLHTVSPITAEETRPPEFAVPKSLESSNLSSSAITDSYTSSIQSSRELILYHSRGKKFPESNFSSPLRMFSPFEPLESATPSPIAQPDQVHPLLPASSIYSPISENSVDVRDQQIITPPPAGGAAFDKTKYAATHRYLLLSGSLKSAIEKDVDDDLPNSDASTLEPVADTDGEASMLIPARLPGIQTCPVVVNELPNRYYPERMNTLLKKFESLKITSPTEQRN